jgi:hypothetical protein
MKNEFLLNENSFPQNVFTKDYVVFFFFDSDWIFEGEFVEKLKTLLSIEEMSKAIIATTYRESSEKHSTFCFKANTLPSEFQSFLFLDGDESGNGWIYDFGIFVCSSDSQEWCIYCERSLEIAVVAFKKNCEIKKYDILLKQLHAVPIEIAISEKKSYGFTQHILPDFWKKQLLLEYKNSKIYDKSEN